MKSIISFFKAPLNQAALVALLGALSAVLQGSLSWRGAIPVAVGAIIAWALPDNSVAKTDIEEIVTEAIKAASDITKNTKTP